MTDQLKQAAQQALEVWDSSTGMKDLCVAMDALRAALEQQAEPVQENQVLIEWKEQGEVIMAQAGVGFRLGVWWADRPWRYVSEFADQRFDVAQQSWTDDLKAALKDRNT